LESEPTVLVLDDYHVIEDSPDAADLVDRFTRDAPPWLRLVVSSRRRPEFETARLDASGDLGSLGIDDLRFTPEETADLFASAFNVRLDDDVLSVLNTRAKGWVASLQLFYGTIKARVDTDVRSIARALSGAKSPIYDFLAEEVLGGVDAQMETFLVRASLLERISPAEVGALFSDDEPPPTDDTIREWMNEADRLVLLSSAASSDETREFHPLLREYLTRQLFQRESPDSIKGMNLRVARAVAPDDPLAAAHYYLEAGEQEAAMKNLNSSLVLTIGSGRWGFAYQLISKLRGVPAGPAVAVIRARQLMEEGDLESAAQLLDAVDVRSAPPDVRAQFHHTMFSLGWRTGERDRMVDGLTAIHNDEDAPAALRDIADLLLNASPPGGPVQQLPVIGARLLTMAENLATQRLTFYSAVALHDGAVAFLNAGDYPRCLDAGSRALDRFSRLAFFAVEQLSTHTAMALAETELGNQNAAEGHAAAALSIGREAADVPAELAGLAVLLGRPEEAVDLIARARSLQQQNQTDAVSDGVLECAVALLELRTDLPTAIARLETTRFDNPFDLGYSSLRDALRAQALLLSGNRDDAQQVAMSALHHAVTHQGRRAEARLRVVLALAERNKVDVFTSVRSAERAGALTLLELADVLVSHVELLQPLPDPIDRSIRQFPSRWLPALRKQLEAGNSPAARAAAMLLESYGSLADVGLLRAYAKTYIRKGPGKSLGRSLARRTSPILEIHDLGRTTMLIAGREVQTSSIRRKSASVLMYLVTRPNFTANREQLIDALWPESDPDAASNNLNQSLYFLRREIDPWYEDDLSVDYVGLQGDMVWLDEELVRSQSADFLTAMSRRSESASDLARAVINYPGQFAPEFEYDEWAMSWRDRTHSTFLDITQLVIADLVQAGDLRLAADVAAHAIQVDAAATDIEMRLVWIYDRMGRHSAARSQFGHLQRQQALDGLEPDGSLAELLAGPLPS
jgi:DNA-binding SARP family transcriptional activator